MDIGLGRIGQIVVDNGMELADVDAPCGDVGGHHDLHLSRLEIAQGPLALPLRLVSVDRFAAYASPFQHAGDVVRAVLRARENEHRLVRLLSEHRYQQALFLRPLDKVDALIHPIDGGRSGRYLDPYRIAQDGARQSHDIPGHGGREKKRLAPDRKQRQQAPDIGDKAHVEHAVRLVQHEMRQAPELDLSLSDQIEQTSGSGDQNIDAPAEPVRLRSLLDSPENRRVLQARILSVIGERLADLKGKFPRGGQNEGPNSTAAAFPVRPSPPFAPKRNGLSRDGRRFPFEGSFLDQSLQEGQGERRRLARARLGDSENIRAPQGDRNSPLLNGRELVVSFFADSLQNRLRHVQFVKCHNDFVSAFADVFSGRPPEATR